MKQLISFNKFIMLILLIIPYHYIYSQSTYDYFEKLRLERKDKKIKVISSFDYLNDALSKKEYYDENGFLKKTEIYGSSFITGDTYLLQEIIINKLSDNGNVSGTITKFESDGSKTDTYEFNDLKPEIFYETNFEDGWFEDVKYLFDSKGNLTEKRFYNKEMNIINKYSKEILIYDDKNRLIESIIYSDNSSGITKYYCNSFGFLEKEEYSHDFQKGERVYGIRYEYEFY